MLRTGYLLGLGMLLLAQLHELIEDLLRSPDSIRGLLVGVSGASSSGIVAAVGHT
jgi:hypothetical protein